MNKGNSGCAMVVVIALVIGLVMVVLGGVLSLLGVLLPIAGVILMILMIGYGWTGFLRGRKITQEMAQVDVELSGMASDAGTRLDQVLWWWEQVNITQGIGTGFEGRIDGIRAADAADPDALQLRQLLGEAREVRTLLLEVTAEVDRKKRLQLVNRADRVWADLTRHYIRAAGTMDGHD